MIPAISSLPRIPLGNYPTPLVEASNLSAALGGPRIFIKRDDLSGLALGGNKCRKLEFVMADARQKGTDAVITTGSSQSNFALQMATAARKLGMEAYLVLVKGVHAEKQGNLLLHAILDSNVNIVEVSDPSEMHGDAIAARMDALADELRQQGRRPLVIPPGAHTNLGVTGWVNAVDEVRQQLQEQKIDARYLVSAHGGSGTIAGLMIGVKYLRLPLKVIGFSVLSRKARALNEIVRTAGEAARFLGMDVTVAPEEVTVYDDYIGEGYGVPTPEGLQAIRLVARTEGIFLDPVYTGKAMAGLIDLIKKGHFKASDTIVFVHTGGIPALFAYDKEIAG